MCIRRRSPRAWALRTARGSGWRIWRGFSTTVTGLLVLADWLKSYEVTHEAMEATGVYWLPVWYILEDDFELTLCNARHVKNVALV
jgi:transposase